jgi:hypothetical protein
MTVYVAQAYVAFDGADVSDVWALGQAQWVKDNTETLTGQALIVPGTAGERSSYCVVSEVAADGSLVPISAWHVNDLGQIVQGLPDGSGVPPVVDAWQPDTAYVTDQVVTYDGVTYRCITGHTSQVGWEPPNVAALWVAI